MELVLKNSSSGKPAYFYQFNGKSINIPYKRKYRQDNSEAINVALIFSIRTLFDEWHKYCEKQIQIFSLQIEKLKQLLGNNSEFESVLTVQDFRKLNLEFANERILKAVNRLNKQKPLHYNADVIYNFIVPYLIDASDFTFKINESEKTIKEKLQDFQQTVKQYIKPKNDLDIEQFLENIIFTTTLYRSYDSWHSPNGMLDIKNSDIKEISETLLDFLQYGRNL